MTLDEEVAVARVGARLMGLKDCDCHVGVQPHWTDALRVYSVNDVLFMMEQRRTRGEQKGANEC